MSSPRGDVLTGKPRPDTVKFSAVVTAWERRFGARVVAAGFATKHLSVALPPRTEEEALQVAA
ncbi:DUF4253 domain-containing protein [Streptodolium elevatio]